MINMKFCVALLVLAQFSPKLAAILDFGIHQDHFFPDEQMLFPNNSRPFPTLIMWCQSCTHSLCAIYHLNNVFIYHDVVLNPNWLSAIAVIKCWPENKYHQMIIQCLQKSVMEHSYPMIVTTTSSFIGNAQNNFMFYFW